MSPRKTSSRRALVAAGAALTLVAGGAAPAVFAVDAATAPSPSPDAPVLPDPTQVHRISGADRYETAAEIAREFPVDATRTVVVASGQNFPDALSAQLPVSMTGAKVTGERFGGMPVPVLLTRSGSLPSATASALADLRPSKIVLLGGSGAVSDEVEGELAGYAKVERVSGADRYETSAAIASAYPAGAPVLFVASGADFPDALSAGAAAGTEGVPVLLTDPDELRGSTAAAIDALAPQQVIVLGGDGAVSDAVVEAITAKVEATSRLAGGNRYETSAALAERFPADVTAYLASGQAFPDALSGGAFAGYHQGPLLLTRADGLPAATANELHRLSPQGVVIFGGEGAVDGTVADTVDAHLPLWFDELVVQMLSFNDYHGHIAEEDGTLTEEQDPEQNLVGGAVNLATTLETLREGSLSDQTVTVAAGDLIGGSTFLSGMFQDEPAVETLDVAGLDISSVGNHEFDEGVEELLRMQHGGNHPELGQFGEVPYPGAGFQWLAANVVDKVTGDPVLPATEVRTIDGVDVGFIGMTLEETPTLVSPAGVANVNFLDEVETANAHAAALQEQGVESIVVLLHEGGYQEAGYNECVGISGPVVEIAQNLDPAIDAVVTGHTHQPYVCSIPDPDGNERTVTSANQYARVVTETSLAVSRSTGDVIRDRVVSTNNLVLQSAPDHPEMVEVVEKWQARAEVVAARVVGSVAEDITGDAGGNRGIETPMANLVSDAILAATDGADEGGAQISFMNVGGVRASLIYDAITNGEEPGEVTYEEAYNVMPFGNLLVSIDMTGAQIKAALEQQFVPERGRQYLALGVSEGFSYTWDDSQPQGSKVSGMTLDGVALEMDETYRVSTLNFLQEGGDMFSAFTEGTNLSGGPEDLAALVAYLQANPGLTAPEDRVNGL